MVDAVERSMAARVIDGAWRLNECMIRFGRTHKVDRRFEGRARRLQWTGSTKKKGGGFVLLCDYNGMSCQTHKTVLKQMLCDYSSYLAHLKRSNIHPIQKRRKPYGLCMNMAINASHDMELQIEGSWVPFGDFLPTSVRELDPCAVAEWLCHHGPKGTYTSAPKIRVERVPRLKVETKAAPPTDASADVDAHSDSTHIHDPGVLYRERWEMPPEFENMLTKIVRHT